MHCTRSGPSSSSSKVSDELRESSESLSAAPVSGSLGCCRKGAASVPGERWGEEGPICSDRSLLDAAMPVLKTASGPSRETATEVAPEHGPDFPPQTPSERPKDVQVPEVLREACRWACSPLPRRQGSPGPESSWWTAHPVTPPRPEVAHQEPEQLALVHVCLMQAVLVTFPLVLLDHLKGWQREEAAKQAPCDWHGDMQTHAGTRPLGQNGPKGSAHTRWGGEDTPVPCTLSPPPLSRRAGWASLQWGPRS